MAKLYYNTLDDIYPYIQKTIIERLRVYIVGKVYPEEDFVDSKNRFVLANFESGTNVAIKECIARFSEISTEPTQNGGNFPFTAYNMGAFLPTDDGFVTKQLIGNYYSDTYQKYVKAIPFTYDIPMITFYSNVIDYNRGLGIFFEMQRDLIRLQCPITINGVLDSFYIDLQLEMDHGEYPYQFEEYLRQNQLWDIRHNITIKGTYFIVPDSTVAEVDDMIVSLWQLREPIEESVKIDTYTLTPTPVVNSTVPSDGDTGVVIDSNIIMNFNVAMNEVSVFENLEISPFIPVNYIFDCDLKELTIELKEDLQTTTEYTIILYDNAMNTNGEKMVEDYSFSFETI